MCILELDPPLEIRISSPAELGQFLTDLFHVKGIDLAVGETYYLDIPKKTIKLLSSEELSGLLGERRLRVRQYAYVRRPVADMTTVIVQHKNSCSIARFRPRENALVSPEDKLLRKISETSVVWDVLNVIFLHDRPKQPYFRKYFDGATISGGTYTYALCVFPGDLIPGGSVSMTCREDDTTLSLYVETVLPKKESYDVCPL